MTREEHLTFCKQCTNRKMDPQLETICALTNGVAGFDLTCANFNKTLMLN